MSEDLVIFLGPEFCLHSIIPFIYKPEYPPPLGFEQRFPSAENKRGRQALETTSERHFIVCHVTKYSTILGVSQ